MGIRSNNTFEKFKTFCPLPWMHLSLHPSGKMRLCCNANHAKRDVVDEKGKSISINQIENVKDFFNLPFYKKIRCEMLKNQKPKACSTCYDMEKYGGNSFRQQFKRDWKTNFSEFLNTTQKDGTLKDVNIKYLDLPLGNLCNLRCRMCHPSNSIQMKKDFDYWQIKYDNSVNKYREWIKAPGLYKKLAPMLKTCEEIFFTGGEPFLIKEHEKILEQAIELKSAKHIKIKYNTNLTKLDTQLMKLWKEFREVKVNCSIDGTGEVNDYIRYPSKWQVMEKTLETLDSFSKEYPHIQVYIHSTFQVLNIFNIPNLLKWTAEVKWKNIHRVPYFIWLHEPKFFRVSVLPDHFKNQAIDEIEKTLKRTSSFFMIYNKNHEHWSKTCLDVLFGHLNHMKSISHERSYFKDFIHYTAKMDNFRKQDIVQIIPEFKEIFFV